MVDNPSSQWSPSHLINIHDQGELQYWTETLNVSEQQLREAVGAVGTDAEAIRRFFASDDDRKRDA
jgi:hypothetical protein